MRLVVICSPFSGDIERNIHYARDCLRDSLLRGEAPIAGHLIYPLVLDDGNQAERDHGMAAGHAWIKVADALVVYSDFGVSKGMKEDIEIAKAARVAVEFRIIEDAVHEA